MCKHHGDDSRCQTWLIVERCDRMANGSVKRQQNGGAILATLAQADVVPAGFKIVFLNPGILRVRHLEQSTI